MYTIEHDGKKYSIEGTGNEALPIRNVVLYRFWGKNQRDVLNKISEWLKKYDDVHIFGLFLESYNRDGSGNKAFASFYRVEGGGIPLCDDYVIEEIA